MPKTTPKSTRKFQIRGRKLYIVNTYSEAYWGVVSLRTAKLTKRRKSVKFEVWSTLGGVSDPGVEEGVPRAARIPSLVGSTAFLVTPGLVNPVIRPGSISRDERKDLSSRLVFVLVTTRKESIRSFCCAGDDPLRSRTCPNDVNRHDPSPSRWRTFWKFEIDASPMRSV